MGGVARSTFEEIAHYARGESGVTRRLFPDAAAPHIVGSSTRRIHLPRIASLVI